MAPQSGCRSPRRHQRFTKAFDLHGQFLPSPFVFLLAIKALGLGVGPKGGEEVRDRLLMGALDSANQPVELLRVPAEKPAQHADQRGQD